MSPVLFQLTALPPPPLPPSAVKTTRRIGFRFAVLVTINDTDPNVVKAAETQEGSGDHTMMFRVSPFVLRR